jgi:hypothetical protein
VEDRRKIDGALLGPVEANSSAQRDGIIAARLDLRMLANMEVALDLGAQIFSAHDERN